MTPFILVFTIPFIIHNRQSKPFLPVIIQFSYRSRQFSDLAWYLREKHTVPQKSKFSDKYIFSIGKLPSAICYLQHSMDWFVSRRGIACARYLLFSLSICTCAKLILIWILQKKLYCKQIHIEYGCGLWMQPMRIAPCSYSCQSVKISSGHHIHQTQVWRYTYSTSGGIHTAHLSWRRSYRENMYFHLFRKCFFGAWLLHKCQHLVGREVIKKMNSFRSFLNLDAWLLPKCHHKPTQPFLRIRKSWKNISATAAINLLFSLFQENKNREQSFNQTACLFCFLAPFQSINATFI